MPKINKKTVSFKYRSDLKNPNTSNITKPLKKTKFAMNSSMNITNSTKFSEKDLVMTKNSSILSSPNDATDKNVLEYISDSRLKSMYDELEEKKKSSNVRYYYKLV